MSASWESARGFAKRSASRTKSVLKGAANNIGVWLLSILATIVLPALPLGIEWLRLGHFKDDTIAITAAVMAAGFIFTACHTIFLSAYILLFIGSLLLNIDVGPGTPVGIDRWSGTLLLSVALLHASERLWWHIILSRPFPEGFALQKDKADGGTS
jgi:hypothetical protein